MTAQQVRGLVVREWPYVHVDVSISMIKSSARIERIRKTRVCMVKLMGLVKKELCSYV